MGWGIIKQIYPERLEVVLRRLFEGGYLAVRESGNARGPLIWRVYRNAPSLEILFHTCSGVEIPTVRFTQYMLGLYAEKHDMDRLLAYLSFNILLVMSKVVIPEWIEKIFKEGFDKGFLFIRLNRSGPTWYRVYSNKSLFEIELDRFIDGGNRFMTFSEEYLSHVALDSSRKESLFFLAKNFLTGADS